MSSVQSRNNVEEQIWGDTLPYFLCQCFHSLFLLMEFGTFFVPKWHHTISFTISLFKPLDYLLLYGIYLSFHTLCLCSHCFFHLSSLLVYSVIDDEWDSRIQRWITDLTQILSFLEKEEAWALEIDRTGRAELLAVWLRASS